MAGTPEDNTVRVVVIKDPAGFACHALSAVIVDGNGTVRVAGKDVGAHEVAPALAHMISETKDAMKVVLGPESVEEGLHVLFAEDKLLAERQELFELSLNEVRQRKTAAISG